MADVGFREVGSFGPKSKREGLQREGSRREAPRREEPTIAPPVAEPSLDDPARDRANEPSVLVTPAPPSRRPVYGGERTDGGDALGIEPTLRRVAELVALGRTATPLTVAFLGGPGSGKTFALARTLAIVREIVGAAGKRSASPFLSRLHVQPIDAAALDEDIVGSLAGIVHAGLRRPYPDLAHSIGHTARDPHVVLREVTEKLDEARRRLDAERHALDEAGTRRARLTETVLFESGGTGVDAYARANRAGIESRLASFGVGGDPIRSYKEMVQYAAGSGGRSGLAMRSLWAFRGQSKLTVLAILLAVVGVGLGVAVDDQATWLGSLRSGPQFGSSVADWAARNIGLLSTARAAAFALAGLAILLNLWRALAFVTPIYKGARLLGADLDARRRDLDGLFGHQTKRVDMLDRDVERLTREVGEAEQRAGGPDSANRSQPSPFAMPLAAQAQGLFGDLAAAMADGTRRDTPQRIVLALDHLDAVAPERARAILDALRRSCGRGIVCLAAADAGRLDPKGLRREELTRWIDVPVRLDADAAHRDPSALVARALGAAPQAGPTARADAATSVLDTPVDETEAGLLAALMPLAGSSPRAATRFVGQYALARFDDTAKHGPLAFMLALSQGGTTAERAAVADALAKAGPESADAFDPPTSSPRLRDALGAVAGMDGPFTAGEMVTAARVAARHTLAD